MDETLEDIDMQDILGLPPATVAKAQEDFERALPRIRTHAKVRFGAIADPARRDDAIAEVVGLGWVHWLSALRHGKDPNEFVSTIADLAVRQVRSCRKVTGSERSRDAMSPLAHRKNGFVNVPLPGGRRPHADIYSRPNGQDECDAAEEGMQAHTQSPVPDQVAFRMDIPSWMERLADKKRRIVKDLMQGDSTQEAAEKHGVSQGRISQIRREAYEDLADYVNEGRVR